MRLSVFAFLAAGSGHGTASSGPSTLLVWLGVISTAATVAAVFFAWRAAVSAREANRYARETAQAAEDANTCARQTAEINREASAYTRETLEIARAAHDADERNRQLQELREIGRLVESIFWQADQVPQDARFRVAEQNQLAQALIGNDPPMPKCAEVVGAATGGQAYGAASQARAEVLGAIAGFRAGWAAGAAAPSP